ncbi:MAG: leucine-rich repeat domain-containing protein [Ruminococcus sp.]|nr:leucine-rich repeat domain-containing protein [Ruminococcus sp.]
MKRIIAAVLAAGLMTVRAGALGSDPMVGVGHLTNGKEPVGTAEKEGCVYQLYDNFAVLYEGKDEERISIPEEVEGLPVEEIGYAAFEDCDSIREVIIPKTVTTVGASAFSGCDSLGLVTVSARFILPQAFSGCTGLTTVLMGDGVEGLDEMAFQGCTSLSNVMMCSTLRSIGNGCFMDDTQLKTLVLPGELVYIGDDALGYYYDSEEQKVKQYGCEIIAKGGTLASEYAAAMGIDLSRLPEFSKEELDQAQEIFENSNRLVDTPTVDMGADSSLERREYAKGSDSSKADKTDPDNRMFYITIGVIVALVLGLVAFGKVMFAGDHKYDSRGNRIDKK